MRPLQRLIAYGLGLAVGMALLTGATWVVPGMWLPIGLTILLSALLYFSPWVTSRGLAGPMSVAILFGVCAGWLATSGVTTRKFDLTYFPSLAFGVMALLSWLFAFASVLAVPVKQRAPGWRLLVVVLLVSAVAAASSSAGSSGVMTRWIMAHLGLDRGETETFVFWARKCIHFIFYGSLALTASAAARRAKEPAQSALRFGFMAAIAVASFDELRQAGLADRTGSFYDVLLDLSGAATFMILAQLRSKPTSARPAKPAPKTPSAS